jgi:hypothetical protein
MGDTADTIIFRTPVFARTDRFATATLRWPKYDVILIDPHRGPHFQLSVAYTNTSS